MKVLKKKVSECIQVRKIVGIGLLIPAIITQVILEVVKVVGIGIKRPDTLPLAIAEVVDGGQF